MVQQTLRTQGKLWGPERVTLGLSIRHLSELTGINRGVLSAIESGRIIPTQDEYDRVMRALRAQTQEEAS